MPKKPTTGRRRIDIRNRTCPNPGTKVDVITSCLRSKIGTDCVIRDGYSRQPMSKRAGRPVTAKAQPRGENIVPDGCLAPDVDRQQASKPAKKAQEAKLATGRKEMQPPIAGKKPGKENASEEACDQTAKVRRSPPRARRDARAVPMGIRKPSVRAAAPTRQVGPC
jgi:hypothetical protein